MPRYVEEADVHYTRCAYSISYRHVMCGWSWPKAFAWIEKLSGRSYSLFEYVGSALGCSLDCRSAPGKSAKYVLIIMGSGAGVVEEYLTKMGDKALEALHIGSIPLEAKDCGCLNVHLYRQGSLEFLLRSRGHGVRSTSWRRCQRSAA